jgi:hypothetical protein
VFFDFDYQPGSLPDGIVHCACLQEKGIVLAMSMPHPPRGASTSPEQLGMKDGSSGIVLPGHDWTLDDDGRITLHGPALPAAGMTLPLGASIDELGFLFLPHT